MYKNRNLWSIAFPKINEIHSAAIQTTYRYYRQKLEIVLKCFELSQTDVPKRAVTVNALSGYDRVLTLLKTWQVLFGLVASVKYPAALLQHIFALCNLTGGYGKIGL